MDNEVKYEGTVFAKPEVFVTEKNLKIATLLVEQEEHYPNFSKSIVVPFKAFAGKCDEVLAASKGDIVKITARLSGRSSTTKDGREWHNSENLIKSITVQKSTQASKASKASAPEADLEDLPF